MAKYLDYAGLQTLVTQIKAGDAAALKAAKDYVGGIPSTATETTVIAYLENKIEEAKQAATFSGKAADVTIEDAGSIYSATSVEAALQEVKAEADASKTALETVQGEATVAGSIKKAEADAKAYADEKIGTLGDGYTDVKDYIDKHDAAVMKIISNEQGTLTDLTTDVKTTIVAAINEVDAHADSAQSDATSALNKIGTEKSGETAGTGLTGRIETLEAAIGEGGGVSTQIKNAIDALDATVTNASTVEGATQPDVIVSVTETDGKLTAVTATVTAERFDAHGAAAAVQGSTTETVASVDAKVEALGTAADKDYATVEIAAESEDANLVSAAQVAKFVKDQVADLSGAMHFRGVFDKLEDVTSPKAGDVAIVGVKEYVYGGSPAAWKELGDETTFVTKTTTIAGVDLENDITAAELRTALNVDDGAQVNVIESVKVNDVALSVSDKTVNVTVATGSANGTVAVNGTDVAVKGLGSAAYTDATAYDAAGVASGLVGDLATLTTTAKSDVVAAINEVDAAVKAVDYSGKADKVASATAGNFAGLDANGNLTDSGKKAADFETAGAAAAVQGSTTSTVKDVEDKVDAITSITTKEITDLFAPAAD